MAKTTIGSMAAYVTADTTSFSTGLNSASKKVSGFSAGVSSSLKKVGAAFAALGAFVAGGKLFSGFTNNLQRIDEIGKAAQRIGITTEALSRLEFAAGQSGVETATLTKSMQLFARNIVDAASGTGEAVQAFDRLGISAADIQNMPLDQSLGMVADALLEVENPLDRVSIAMDLFGARGAGLLNTLAGGSKGLQEMAKRSDELGNTISGKTFKSVEAFNDAMDRLKVASAGVFTSLAKLMPTIQKVIDTITSGVSKIRDLDLTLVRVVAQVAAFSAGLMAGLAIVPQIIVAIKAVIAMLKSLSKAQAVVHALAGPAGLVALTVGLAAAAASAVAVDRAFRSIEQSATSAMSEAQEALLDTDALVEQLDASVEGIAESVEAVADPLEEAWQSTRQWADAFDDAREAAARIFDETRTDSERLAMKIAEINQLFRDGHLDIETYNRAIRNASIKPDESVSRIDTRRVTREADFAALGAANATGRKTDQMLKTEQDQLAEAKASRRIQEETLKAIRSTGSLELVNF